MFFIIMEKTKTKFGVDTLMFLDFLVLAISGFVLWFGIPRNGSSFTQKLIFSRWEWLKIHDWTSIILVILILVHLLLNWTWIKCMILGFFKKK